MPHLKYLHLYPNDMVCHYVEAGVNQGLLLTYDRQLLSWDRTAYSQADRVFMPVATTPDAARMLVDHIFATYDRDQAAVFKFCDELTRSVFGEVFALQPVRAFVSYTGSGAATQDCVDPEVVIAHEPAAGCLDLFAQNGYMSAEMQRYFDTGAMSFALYDGAEPGCACFIYPNFGTIWEIAGLHTRTEARRRGYARRVVLAALQTIWAQGWIPRYHVETTNTASLTLAETLGLVPCLRFEHYLSSAT